jgi:thymidylate synthase
MSIVTANHAWLYSVSDMLHSGKDVAPRGQKTKEIVGESISFDMNHPICYHQDRKLNYSFMAAEAYWIVSGSMFVEDIAPYNKHISQFSDDKYIFNGAYGPKFVYQLDYVVNALLRDSSTRQAVMSIWVNNPMRTADYPCTLNLQWLLRDNKLHCIVNMRSNDLWLGRPYDLFNFTIMTLRVLCMYNQLRTDEGRITELGTLRLNVGSGHLYEQHYEQAALLATVEPDKITSEVPITALYNWRFVVESLLACRDKSNVNGLWGIRP